MRGILLIFLSLAVGTFAALPHFASHNRELRMLQRLIKVVEASRHVNTKALPDINTWLEDNINDTLLGDVDLHRVQDEHVADEIARLVAKYLEEPDAKKFSNCVYIFTSMGLMKHLIINRLHLGVKLETAGVAGTVVMQEPVGRDAIVELEKLFPNISQVLTGPANEALSELTSKMMGLAHLDIDIIEKMYTAEEDEIIGKDHIDTNAEKMIKDTLMAVGKAVKALSDNSVAESVCMTDLPTQLRDTISAKLAIFANQTNNATLQKAMNISNKPQLQKLIPKIVKEMLNNSELLKFPQMFFGAAMTVLNESLSNNETMKDTFFELMKMTATVEIEIMKAMVQAHDVVEDIEEHGQKSVLDTKLKDTTKESLVELMKEIEEHSKPEGNVSCMALKKVAGVVGVLQTERMRLMSSKTKVVTDLAANISKEINAALPQNGTSVNLEQLRRNVTKLVSKIFIAKLRPLLRKIDEVRKDSLFLMYPIAAMFLAKTEADKPTRDTVVQLVLMLTAAYETQKHVDCTGKPLPNPQELENIMTKLAEINGTESENRTSKFLGNICDSLSNQPNATCPLLVNGVKNKITMLLTTEYKKAVEQIIGDLKPVDDGLVGKRIATYLFEGSRGQDM